MRKNARRRIYNSMRYMLLLIIAVIAAACSASIEETLGAARSVRIDLPSPEDFARLGVSHLFCGWRVDYYGHGLEAQSKFIAPHEGSFVASLPSDCPAPVIATPLFLVPQQNGAAKQCEIFKPAGCIFPHQSKASWRQGFSADVLFSLYNIEKTSGTIAEAGAVCSMFNWPRFMETVEKEGQPWLLDKQRALDSLSAQKFSVYSIKKLPCASLPGEALVGIAKNLLGIYEEHDAADNEIVLLSDYVPDNPITAQSGLTVTAAKNSTVPFFLPLQNSIIAVEFE